MIRVVLAEDSSTIREILVAILESDPEIRVVAQARNGAEAIDLVLQHRPDLVTMDIHMPIMDGLEATKEIMVRAPTPIVIVSASTKAADVGRSLDALRAGALMLVEKPVDPASPLFDGQRQRFLDMIKAMAAVKVVRHRAPPAARLPASPPSPSTQRIRLVAIGASTGGPAALQRILADLPRDFPVPIVVVQHIATDFVGALADWLAGSCLLRVKVAEDGESLAARTVYLAPDHAHMGVTDGCVVLDDGPPLGGHRPAITHLFNAVAGYGAGLVAVQLTGMGRDGVAGLTAVKAAGGYVIGQDESSSVVYGMPREAVAAGVVTVVLPLDGIAEHLTFLVRGGTDADTAPDR